MLFQERSNVLYLEMCYNYFYIHCVLCTCTNPQFIVNANMANGKTLLSFTIKVYFQINMNTIHKKEATVTMFRLWARIFKNNHMLKDTVVCDSSQDTRTHKVFRALETVCYEIGRAHV